MHDQRKPEPGDWIQIYDEDRESGEVTAVEDDAVTYWDHNRKRFFTVPHSVVILVDHPDIDEAAHDILDVLCVWDPSWKQNPTLDLRRRIVRTVMRAVRPDHPGLKRPGVTDAV